MVRSTWILQDNNSISAGLKPIRMDVNTYRLQQNWNKVSGELATKILTSPYRFILLPSGDTAWMRVQDVFIQNANPYECPPPLFREEEVSILGTHSREEDSILGTHSREGEILERDYAERPPPLPPPPFPEEPVPDPVAVDDVETDVDEREESAPLEPLPEELVPEPPRPRQVQFAEDLVQYDDDPVDTGARGSDGYRTPSVPSQIPQAPHRYRTRRNAVD
eukprot:3119718-Amphidinium_carterae.3